MKIFKLLRTIKTLIVILIINLIGRCIALVYVPFIFAFRHYAYNVVFNYSQDKTNNFSLRYFRENKHNIKFIEASGKYLLNYDGSAPWLTGEVMYRKITWFEFYLVYLFMYLWLNPSSKIDGERYLQLGDCLRTDSYRISYWKGFTKWYWEFAVINGFKGYRDLVYENFLKHTSFMFRFERIRFFGKYSNKMLKPIYRTALNGNSKMRTVFLARDELGRPKKLYSLFGWEFSIRKLWLTDDKKVVLGYFPFMGLVTKIGNYFYGYEIGYSWTGNDDNGMYGRGDVKPVFKIHFRVRDTDVIL